MIFYIYDDKTRGRIARICRKENVELLTQADVLQRVELPAGNDLFIYSVDALILEMTKPTRTSQFILAHAMLASRPTLILYAKNQVPRYIIDLIRRHKSPRSIKTYSYMDHSLAPAIQKFIRSHQQGTEEHDNLSSIKYTLRLSPRVDRYLEWKCRQTHKVKADLLREMIDNVSSCDSEYNEELVKTYIHRSKNKS